MLVLSRKKNDQIVIDGQITVEILQIKGNNVRIGISAPRDVKVLRGELKPFGMSDENETGSPEQVIECLLPISQAS